MSLMFMESFDGYGSASFASKWTGGFAITGGQKRTGTHACFNGTRSFSPASNVVIIQYATYYNPADGGSSMMRVNNAAGTTQCTMHVGSTGGIAVTRSTGTTLEASPVGIMSTGWNYIEFKLTVNTGTSGAWTVKLNGVQQLNGTGNTSQDGTTSIGQVQLASSFMYFDDLIVMDNAGSYLNDFIGDCKIECDFPSTGNGDNTGLTPSTGTDHGALVDESLPNDDTDYNFGTTPGVKDTYNFPALDATGTVYAVQVAARVKKTDSATKEVALVTRIGGTDYDGSTQAISTSYSQYLQIWEKRPSDAASWEPSDFGASASEVGLKVVT